VVRGGEHKPVFRGGKESNEFGRGRRKGGKGWESQLGAVFSIKERSRVSARGLSGNSRMV